jgi:hypothetical protein
VLRKIFDHKSERGGSGGGLRMLHNEKLFTHVIRCCYGSEIEEAVQAAGIEETRFYTEF